MKQLTKLLLLISFISLLISCQFQDDRCDDCSPIVSERVKFTIRDGQNNCLFGCVDSVYEPRQMSIYLIDEGGDQKFQDIGSPASYNVYLQIGISDTFYFAFDNHVDLLFIQKRALPSSCPQCPKAEITAMSYNDNLVCID